MAKQYVDLNGITVYDEEIKAYIAEHGGGANITVTTTDPGEGSYLATGDLLIVVSDDE